jgi:hypothetical protein
MSFVGLDIDRCCELKAHLDQACQDINAHAATVEALLAQAGIVSCRAPAELRDVAAWADYRSRDLQKRIDRMRAANGGGAPGFRFASPKVAKDAGKHEGDEIKKRLEAGDPRGAADELAKVKAYAGDPGFAAALLHALGSSTVLELLRGIDPDGSTRAVLPPPALAALAALLATVSRANPDDPVVKSVLDHASPSELAALLKFGGFSSAFVSSAAGAILKSYPPLVGTTGNYELDKKMADARQAAIDALKADPQAALGFFSNGNDQAVMSLLRDPDPKHIAVLTQALASGFASGDRVAQLAIERILRLIAKDGDISAAAKQALARLLVPAFFDDRLLNTKLNKDPSLALKPKELVDALAVLMTDDKARKTIFDAAGAALAKDVAGAVPDMLAHLHDKDVTSAEPQALDGGKIMAIVQQAYAKMLGDDAKQAEAEAEMLKTAGHILGAILLEGAPPGVGGAADYAIDHLADSGKNGAIDRLAAADETGPLSDSETQIAAAVARVLAQDPNYAASLARAGLMKNGRLVNITKFSPEERRLNNWLGLPENANLQRKIHDLLLQFEAWMKR